MKNWRQISDIMYQNHGTTGLAGRAFFEQYEGEIQHPDSFNFILLQCKNYSSSYIVELLLSLPSLWRNSTVEDWKDLIVNIGPRPTDIKPFDDNGAFADILFMSKYLRVDPFCLALSINHLSLDDKIAIVSYGKKNAPRLLFTQLDKEDFEDGYYQSASSLDDLRLNLLEDRHVHEFNFKPDTIGPYLDQLI